MARLLLGAVAALSPPPPDFVPVSAKSVKGDELSLIALFILPCIAICLIIGFCFKNRKHWSEAQSDAKSEEHITGPREYPLPSAYTELKPGVYEGSYSVLSRQGGKYVHQLEFVIDVQKSADPKGRAAISGSATEQRVSPLCTGGTTTFQYRAAGTADFGRAKGVIRCLVQGSVEAVLLYEQVDSTQIAGRLLMGKANGRPVPHPFKLAYMGEAAIDPLGQQQRQQMEFMPDAAAYASYDYAGHGGGYGGGAGYYEDPHNPYAGHYPPPGYAEQQAYPATDVDGGSEFMGPPAPYGYNDRGEPLPPPSYPPQTAMGGAGY